MGERAGARNRGREDVIARHGFDVKYAMHMVRLGMQGVELLSTGRITLPVPEPGRSWLRDLRAGRVTMTEALEAASVCEAELQRLVKDSPLPGRPDRARVDRWLAEVHQRFWRGER